MTLTRQQTLIADASGPLALAIERMVYVASRSNAESVGPQRDMEARGELRRALENYGLALAGHPPRA